MPENGECHYFETYTIQFMFEIIKNGLTNV